MEREREREGRTGEERGEQRKRESWEGRQRVREEGGERRIGLVSCDIPGSWCLF